MESQEIPYILSLAYRKQIDDACLSLEKLGLQYFVMYIVFNDGTPFVLSNIYSILKPYYLEGLYKEDYTFSKKMIQGFDENYYLCDQAEAISKGLKKELAEKYSVFPTYNLIRPHSECTFIFSAIRNAPVVSPQKFYEETCFGFENFCISFVDKFLELIIQSNPSYRLSFILTNKTLRDAVIKQGFEEKITLSARQQECLWLAAQGKKIKTIAKELNLSPYTVEEYLREVRRLLNCESLTQAMFESIQRGLIGKVSYFKSSNETQLLQPKEYFARPMRMII